MKCCVPSCGLTNRKHPSSVLCEHERSTFQEFPTLPWLKKAWLERVGINECDLPQGAVVCKRHFVKDDFFEIGKHPGIMKLRKNSVPSVFKSNSTFEFCVICLDTGASKLYVLKKSRLAQAFTSMTGLQIKVVRDLIKTAPKLCTECAQRLTNCEEFKHKAMRAHDVLILLLQKDKVITAESIKSVNRVDNLLISNMVKHTFRPDHCDLRLVHNEGDNNVHQETSIDIISENSHENMSKPEENATDNEKDYLNDLNDIYSNQIVKRHELDDDDGDSIADNVANNKGDSDLEVECLDVAIERDLDDIDDNSKHDKDVDDGSKHDDDSKHDTDVEDVSKHDNDVNDDSKNDKDTYNDILNDIDIDISNIDKLLNKKYINKSLLDKLKATNNSKNRVSLNNVIFVKDAKPVSNKDNANLNPIREIDITVHKSVTNEHINKQRKEKKQEQNSKRNEEGKGTNKQSEVEAIYNEDSGDNNEKSIITRSKSKSLSQVVKINEDVSKSIKTCDFSGMELKFLTRTKLTYEEQIADVQKRKDTERYKSSPYKCDICFKGFWQLPSYNMHMVTHSNKYGHLECAICGVHTKSFSRLRKHLSSVHSERYNCTLCEFTTSARIVALSHDQWHRGQTLRCSKCDAEFRNRSSYLSHIRIKHPSHYACALCGYSFVSPAGVKAHIRLKHPFDDVKKVSGPSCQECEIRFASDTAYQQHLKVSPKHAALGRSERNAARSTCVYTQPRLKNRRCVSCPLCEKAFSAPAKLREHMCLHTGEKPYECEECGKAFTQKFNHKLHMRTHADNPLRFPCEVCHKDFSSVCNRARHMKSHTGSRPAHKCGVCDKTFTTVAGRDCHVAHVHHSVPRPKRLRTRSHADTEAIVTRETLITSVEEESILKGRP